MTVIRLASSQERVPPKACPDCRFYHPNLKDWGETHIEWSLWPLGKKITRLPTSQSHMNAVCSGFGGRYAQTERSETGRCKPEGLMFDRREK